MMLTAIIASRIVIRKPIRSPPFGSRNGAAKDSAVRLITGVTSDRTYSILVIIDSIYPYHVSACARIAYYGLYSIVIYRTIIYNSTGI